MTVTLKDARGLTATITPDHGAAVVSIALPDGRELLSHVSETARARLLAEAPPHADPSQVSWMRGSSGGWELMAPNIGDAGHLGDRVLEFHGTAGRIPWRVVDRRDDRATFTSEIPGYRFERTVSVGPTHVEVTETLDAAEAAPATWGSHLAFGRSLLDGAIELDLPGRVVGGVVDGVSRSNAELDDWVRSPRDGGSALAYVDCAGVGRASVRNRSQRLEVSIGWDAAEFPYLWVWVELGATTGWPWFGELRALGIEPVSAWPADGTAALAAAGRDVTLTAGPRSARVRIDVHEIAEDAA